MGKRRILIIDDEASFTAVVKINLEKTGQYEVTVENKGERAFDTVRACMPDLILLDIVMPDRSGDDVAAQLKQDETTAHIPIIFLTAVVKKEETEPSGGLIGGKRFLAKPVSVNELLAAIEKAFA